MNFLRKFTLFLVSSAFLGLLFLVAGVWTLRQTVMDRTVVKSWLAESGVYDGFIDQAARIAKEQTSKQAEAAPEGENFDPTVFVAAAQSAFPPNVLRENVEKVLDGTYDWLEGRTDSLRFTLDLSEERRIFIDSLGSQAMTRVAGLPACTEGIGTENFDPFQAACAPTGFDAAAQIENLKTELAANPDFFGDPVITESDVKINNESPAAGNTSQTQKSPGEVFKEAPRWYGYAKLSPVALSLLAVLNAVFIWLLSRPHKTVLKKLGGLFLSASIALAISGAGSRLLMNWLSNGGLKMEGDANGVAEAVILPLIREVNRSLAWWSFVFAGLYAAVAIVLLAIWFSVRHHRASSPLAAEEPAPPINDSSGKNAKPIASIKAEKPTAPKDIKGVPEVPKKRR